MCEIIKEIDSKEVRMQMYYYFCNNGWNYPTTITKVETFETSKGLLIKIETHRPGLLIGEGGSFIDGLEKWLKTELKRNNITIDLNECELWNKLY